MGLVSNRFTMTAIHDGQTVNAIMRANTTLSQRINRQSGECVPNWNTTHPQIWAETDLSGEKKAPSTYTWKYNGLTLTFGADNLCTTVGYEGCFKKTTKSVDGKAFPAISIMKNLATVENTDNDIIEISGSVELSGAQLPFGVALPVRISELSASGYSGVLGGDVMVTSAQPTASVEGRLYAGTSQVTDKFWTKWYDEGTGQQIGSTIASTAVDGEQVAKFSIADTAITDYITLRCEFYTEDPTSASAAVQASAFWEVDDETDDEKMYVSTVITNNTSSANKGGIFLRSGQSVTITGWMGKNTSPTTIDTRYTHFYCRLYDHENKVITASGSPMGGKTPVASGDNKGLFDVTKSVSVPDVTGSVTGGQLTVDFDYLTGTLGDDGSGVMIAATYDVLNP